MTYLERLEQRVGPLPDWHYYDPDGLEYLLHTPNICEALFKIGDVFHTYANARAALIFTDQSDYGTLVDTNSSESECFVKAMFLQQALFGYNSCIDLSWQVLWLYYETKELDLLLESDRYEKSLNGCNLETLNGRLIMAKDNKMKDFVLRFTGTESYQKIREPYNYLKHRGAFHIPGLGYNEKYLPIGINGDKLACFHRRELIFVDWIENLVSFHHTFKEYFEVIINAVVPRYSEHPVNMNRALPYIQKIIDYKEIKVSGCEDK